MFSKILVANRGEIALRVLRTCREMGIKSVAVYSDADETSVHRHYADEAVNIGPPLVRKSYLNADRILEEAKKMGVDAIHPGYGFLSENSAFSQACEDNNIKFIGPCAKAMDLSGEKITALKIAAENNVPLTPGSDGALADKEEAVKYAKKIGYPVILKASGGGGGRGMKIANNDQELIDNFSIARGEVMAAFNNPDIYVEKYLEAPRHVELQVLADEHGNCIHLGERECSVQRNYQKLIEEAPSPFLDPQLRQKMGDASIKLIKAVGYANAGTVEFLVDADKNFYFNEINARLQVEHPVTEMVYGLDLVKQQIKIAAGEKLELEQNQIRPLGWAFECRINAEDPANNFAPMPGKLTEVNMAGGIGIRTDTHIYQGYEIPPFYDSLIAKLLVWGETRVDAVRRMVRALSEFKVKGLPTTIPFHLNVMNDPDFIAGNISTKYIDTHPQLLKFD